MKQLARCCALFWILANLLSAQEADVRKVKFRVLCYEHTENLLKALADDESKGTREVSFFTGGFGPQMVGRFIGNKARFFTESPGPDGKPVRTIVAEGDLVASEMQMFLLLPQTKKQGVVYKIIAFDDLEQSFPMGSTRVINLTTSPVRLNLAGEDMPPIKPGGIQVYPQIKKVDEWNMFSARVDFALEADKWTPVAMQSWKAINRKRDWVIAQFDPITKTPGIRIYQDVPPWREGNQPEGSAEKKP